MVNKKMEYGKPYGSDFVPDKTILHTRRLTGNQYKALLTDHLYPIMKHFIIMLGVVSSRMTLPSAPGYEGSLNGWDEDENDMS